MSNYVLNWLTMPYTSTQDDPQKEEDESDLLVPKAYKFAQCAQWCAASTSNHVSLKTSCFWSMPRSCIFTACLQASPWQDNNTEMCDMIWTQESCTMKKLSFIHNFYPCNLRRMGGWEHQGYDKNGWIWRLLLLVDLAAVNLYILWKPHTEHCLAFWSCCCQLLSC